MYGYHVRFRDEQYILKSNHVYHKLFLLHMQKHVYVLLYETSHFPDRWCCTFVFLLLPESEILFHLQNFLLRLQLVVENHFYHYLSKVSSHVPPGLSEFLLLIPARTIMPVHVPPVFSSFYYLHMLSHV